MMIKLFFSTMLCFALISPSLSSAEETDKLKRFFNLSKGINNFKGMKGKKYCYKEKGNVPFFTYAPICPADSVEVTEREYTELQRKYTSPTKNKAKTENENSPSTQNKNMKNVSINGIWEGRSDLKGSLTYTDGTSTGALEVVMDDLKCVGQWVYSIGEHNTSSLPQGTWVAACSNNKNLRGVFQSNKPGAGHASGVDNDGNIVSFTYE